MGARIHPGQPILIMDHSVITLHEGGRVDGAETAMLSLYDIAYSAKLGAGHVALLSVPSAGIDAVFTDRLDLGRAMQARLLGMGSTMPMLSKPPIPMTDMRRDPWVEGWFGYRFRAVGVDVVARWEELDAPFYAEGPDGGFSPTEDIWSFFVGARSASIVINGTSAPGAPFDDDSWRNRLGRSVSSAHSALGETRITPDAGRQSG
jgi:hypothetical protein